MAAVDGGPVVAHAQAFADEINRRFGFTHIMTYAGHEPDQQHALDNFSTQEKMLELAWWCTRDDVIDHFGIDYVIFNADPNTVGGEIWNRELKRAWRQMPDRGSVTQNHHDHVHVSFNPTGSATPFGGPPSPIPIILEDPDDMASIDHVLLPMGGEVTLAIDNIVNGATGFKHCILRVPFDHYRGGKPLSEQHRIRAVANVRGAGEWVQAVPGGEIVVTPAGDDAYIDVHPDWAEVRLDSLAERDPMGDAYITVVYFR